MEKKTCKYCDSDLIKVRIPHESDWNVDFMMVCLNDECGYYQRGWAHMEKNYQAKASYRYRYDPTNNLEGPLPVKNPNDLKDWVADQ